MNEEEKAIEFLKNKTTNYSLSGEELHYYLILYYLIINLQKENQKLKASEKARKEAIAYIKENSGGICYFDKEENRYKTNESKVLEILDIDK